MAAADFAQGVHEVGEKLSTLSSYIIQKYQKDTRRPHPTRTLKVLQHVRGDNGSRKML
jgi:hypothetical protein